MASPDLIWQCVKKNNAFLTKNMGVQFSKEKGNLMSLNSFKHSGGSRSSQLSAIPKGMSSRKALQFSFLMHPNNIFSTNI
jgi:hypothetical protein